MTVQREMVRDLPKFLYYGDEMSVQVGYYLLVTNAVNISLGTLPGMLVTAQRLSSHDVLV